MPVGRFAKLALLVPAAMISLGMYSLVAPSTCPSFGPQVPPCDHNATANNPCPAWSGAAETYCTPPIYAWAAVVVGIFAAPLAYMFNRSRFYTPLPP